MTSARPGGRARALTKVGRTSSLFEEQSRKRTDFSTATQSMELSLLSAIFGDACGRVSACVRARTDGRKGVGRQ